MQEAVNARLLPAKICYKLQVHITRNETMPNFPALMTALMTALPLAALLTSCSEQPATPPQTTSPNMAPVEATTYDISLSIREIMATLVDINADAIWNSVKVVSDSNGIIEYVPETDEDWASLRANAIGIIEGSNALMMPGRKVAPPGAQGEFPDYEFTPEEVEAKLAADRLSWVGFARGLQNAAKNVLGAIDARDTDKLSEYGANLDEACEACHANYWYRAGI